MNKKDKIVCEMKYRGLLDFNSMGQRSEGCAKYWRGTTYDHWRVLSDIVYALKTDYKMKVYTEAIFKNGGRADIFAYDGPFAVIIEVLHTEKEAKAIKKNEYYPQDIPIIMIKTKDFSVDKFKL